MWSPVGTREARCYTVGDTVDGQVCLAESKDCETGGGAVLV